MPPQQAEGGHKYLPSQVNVTNTENKTISTFSIFSDCFCNFHKRALNFRYSTMNRLIPKGTAKYIKQNITITMKRSKYYDSLTTMTCHCVTIIFISTKTIEENQQNDELTTY